MKLYSHVDTTTFFVGESKGMVISQFLNYGSVRSRFGCHRHCGISLCQSKLCQGRLQLLKPKRDLRTPSRKNLDSIVMRHKGTSRWLKFKGELEFSDSETSRTVADALDKDDYGISVSQNEGTKEDVSRRLPRKYKVILATACAFVIGNMDKVNISIAAIPMAKEFGWSPTVIGLIQSSFFTGYIVSQIPSGYASSKFGGKHVLGMGVGLWSLATAMIPFVSSGVTSLCFSRAAVGLGEGLAPSSAVDLIAKTMSPEERARTTSFVFGGLHVGSLLALIVAPTLIDTWGWPSVFYLFGMVGFAWNIWWYSLMREIREEEPDLIMAIDGLRSEDEEEEEVLPKTDLPWRAFLRSKPLGALAFVHFCNNWFHYTMLAWLPTYFTDTMDLPLSMAARISLLPPIAAIAVSAIAGPSADALISQGVPVGIVRKGVQTAAFIGPALCLLGAMNQDEPTVSLALVTGSLGLASFSLAGLYCNHADLSPKYAPLLLGATNTAGALPGIIGVIFCGAVYDATESWSLALFAPAIALFILGTIIFIIYGTSEPQNFDRRALNKKFAWEKWLGGSLLHRE